MTHGLILEHFRGKEEGQAISEALASPMMAESEAARADPDAEFADFLLSQHEALRKARRKELMARLAQGSLSPDEEREYRELWGGST